MRTVFGEVVRRVLGYGSVAAGAWVGTKTGDAGIGEWIATGVALIGAFILNRALPVVVPTTRKVIAHQPPQQPPLR